MNLMMDEGLIDPNIIKALDAIRKLNISTTLDCQFNRGTSDHDLVYKGTVKLNKILVSKNIDDMNEVDFPPCGHGGIIAFHENELTADYVVRRVKAIQTLGLSGKIKNHVTKIYDERIEIHTLDGVINKNFKDNERTKRINS
jgi:hypothetical protein